ncbi:hypothetical protein P2318_02120 [Myxococcaceae bacterium GXIMD 01537]
MRETLELRVREEEARQFFRPDEGVVLPVGDIRKVVLPLDDERLVRIGELDRELMRTTNRSFFFGWEIRRRYSPAEIRAAELFRLFPQATFEPSGEECGTRYDESTACPHCGAGAVQASELALDLRRIPKKADIARTIADELVVSARLSEALRSRGITGADFRPVKQAGTKGRVSQDWFQLVVTARPVDVVKPTVAGIDPFDLDEPGEHRCPLGHVAGLNLLSELHVDRSGLDGSDVTQTRQLFGRRTGLLRPRPLLLITPKLRALLAELNVKRLKVEVAHLASVGKMAPTPLPGWSPRAGR